MVQVLFRFMNRYLKELGGCKKGYFSRWLNANIVEKCLRKWFQSKQETKNDGAGEHRGEGGDCLGGISPPAVTQSWRPGIWRVFVLRERAGRKEDEEDAGAALGPACMPCQEVPRMNPHHVPLQTGGQYLLSPGCVRFPRSLVCTDPWASTKDPS